ncbi:MAG: LLM class F420-dependent oxidoreductase [Chloroflexota bacterium]
MRVSIEVVQQGLTWEQIRERVQGVESLGFDGAWVFDHFKPIGGDPDGPCLEGWTLLAALAASTSRIRLGTLVTGMTYRHPSILAAEAVTVDHVSGGRLEIGLGAGWFEGEHRELGITFPRTRERTERLEEGIEVIRTMMTGDGATYNGRYYHLEGVRFRPEPVQKPHPPIWVGASGEKLMLPIVARQADVWHASAPVDEMLRKSALLDRYAEDARRDPAEIGRAASIRPAEPFDDTRHKVETLRGARFTHLVCVWPEDGLRRLEEFAHTLLPELQAEG